MRLLIQFSLLCLFVLPAVVTAELRVASIFGDHMVLQQKEEVPVWGTSDAGTEINVTFREHTINATADESGNWKAVLPALKAGDSSELIVTSGTQEILFKDVLVGEVWICSGQSNMQWTISQSGNPEAEAQAANYPNIRLFTVVRNATPEPQQNVKGQWQLCSPDTVKSFSAVAYHFGRHLHENLDVPIGLISTNWGGTPAEAWTPLLSLEADPDFEPILNRRLAAIDHKENGLIDPKVHEKKLNAFLAQATQAADNPKQPAATYLDPEVDPADMELLKNPANFLTQTDGIAYLRTTFELTETQASQAANLKLGAIDDFDATWVNQSKVGETKTDTPNAHLAIRSYPVAAETLRAGNNVVLVQVVDWLGGATLGGQIPEMHLALENGERIPLTDSWSIKLVTDWGSRPINEVKDYHRQGGMLYNGMIAPLIPFSIQGAIWYQGESNAGRAVQYETLFPTMIQSWRDDWQQGEFPFYFVQLANFRKRNDQPVESSWAELREAQRLTLAKPNTGMAVAIEIGEANDIHPKNKRDVGIRLALWALANTYQQKDADGFLASLPLVGSFFEKPLPHSGPLYTSKQINGSQILIEFDHTYAGLSTSDNGPVKGFAIAEKDGEFQWAEAEINGSQIILSHPEMQNPQDVRYGWSDNPEVNLINSAGLPASPFRTDDRKLTTEGKR